MITKAARILIPFFLTMVIDGRTVIISSHLIPVRLKRQSREAEYGYNHSV